MGQTEDGQAQTKGGRSPAQDFREAVGQAIESGLPRFYFNGFAIAQGAGDVTIILQLNDSPSALLHASLETAKTFCQKLDAGIREYEVLTGKTIATFDDVQSAKRAKASGSE